MKCALLILFEIFAAEQVLSYFVMWWDNLKVFEQIDFLIVLHGSTFIHITSQYKFVRRYASNSS